MNAEAKQWVTGGYAAKDESLKDEHVIVTAVVRNEDCIWKEQEMILDYSEEQIDATAFKLFKNISTVILNKYQCRMQ